MFLQVCRESEFPVSPPALERLEILTPYIPADYRDTCSIVSACSAVCVCVCVCVCVRVFVCVYMDTCSILSACSAVCACVCVYIYIYLQYRVCVLCNCVCTLCELRVDLLERICSTRVRLFAHFEILLVKFLESHNTSKRAIELTFEKSNMRAPLCSF